MRTERIGDAVLYLADWREVASSIRRPAAVVSDPPYGMNWNPDSTRFTGGNIARGRTSGGVPAAKRGSGRVWPAGVPGDREPFDPAPVLRLAGHVVLWGSNHYAQRLPTGRTLVWIKKPPQHFGTFLSDAEIGWATGGHGVWCFYHPGYNGLRRAEGLDNRAAHPNQKPIRLMEWCLARILRLPPGATVLDPYMGSGTTGVACVRRGLPFVGVELVPEYFEAACRRIEAAVRGKTEDEAA